MLYIYNQHFIGDGTWLRYVQSHGLMEIIQQKGKAKIPARVGSVVDGSFHVIPVLIATSGGFCKKMVESQLSNMFYRCGLQFDFVWDEEYWNMNTAPVDVQQYERPRHREEATEDEYE